MPTYEYACRDCGHQFERFLRLRDRKEVQVCDVCQSLKTEKIITTCNFILKGDGWPGKTLRISSQMDKKNERLERKQGEMKRDAPGMKLAPNVEGERVDSWSEAQRLAASKGKDAQSYETLVQQEKSQ